MPRVKTDEQIMKESGRRVSHEMQNRRITSKELAKAVGLNPVQVSYIRTGSRPLSEDVAQRIAEYLSQKPFLRGDNSPETMSDLENRIENMERADETEFPDKEEQLHKLKREKIRREKNRFRVVTPEYLMGKTEKEQVIREDTEEEKSLELWSAIARMLVSCGYDLQQAKDVPLINEKEINWNDERWQKAEKNFEAIIKRDGGEKAYHLTPSEQFMLFSQICNSTKNVIENFLMAKDIAEHFKN